MKAIFLNSGFRDYYALTKPGIIYGNAVTFAGGFFLASRGTPNLWLFIFALLGILLVIASSCVFNNFIDRDIDAVMERTMRRALPSNRIPILRALVFAVLLGIFGIGILATTTNYLTLVIALLGAFFYVVVYSLWTKRQSVHGTLVGTISGATPPVIGYVAVTNTLDLGALMLFVILVLWQMPHFYAIAIYRLTDYMNAKIPVLPAKSGIYTTKIHMSIYVLLFLNAVLLFSYFGYAGRVYPIVLGFFGLIWLAYAVKGFWIQTESANKKWAKEMFLISIFIITIFSLTISLDAVQ